MEGSLLITIVKRWRDRGEPWLCLEEGHEGPSLTQLPVVFYCSLQLSVNHYSLLISDTAIIQAGATLADQQLLSSGPLIWRRQTGRMKAHLPCTDTSALIPHSSQRISTSSYEKHNRCTYVTCTYPGLCLTFAGRQREVFFFFVILFNANPGLHLLSMHKRALALSSLMW